LQHTAKEHLNRDSSQQDARTMISVCE